jgi:diaminopimelate decarboxylase
VDEEELRRCKIYRKSFAQTQIALPATALRNQAIAKWVRDHRVSIDVRTGEELATALAVESGCNG